MHVKNGHWGHQNTVTKDEMKISVRILKVFIFIQEILKPKTIIGINFHIWYNN